MKNITVSVDEETYRNARIEAARRETSVSALVRGYLETLCKKSEFERMKAEEQVIRERITNFSARDRLTRDEIYDRSKKY